ncbi:right-handed parallel beta-helix repeat-containing protein [Bradyrhizobium sp. CNPSo 4010]|uniref:Right-handed parallel beta-helix repeat-containing protein n=1 Tax=Bradyrhizobium agreste TaxID=2751811 RepID=A0ABS0PME6_9BRAD|nr:Ig-like domain-containing protein [Bradyrhizobium agreste]MBH5398275.1 right-handed parallel beta-helix repeat-containing protein [Bradyrhizobium agreste]
MTTYNGTVYPDATNTGVPAGTALTPHIGDLVVTTAGAVISGLDITGSVIIKAPNVTVENCKITSTDFAVVNIYDGITGTTIQNCTISGTGAGPQGQNGIGGSGTFLNNNIYGTENGINVEGSNTVIKGNYIHDLNDSAGAAGHYDGIQVDGGFNNVTISQNTVFGRDTSCIFICNDFGPMDNIVVDRNLLLGQNDAAATIYVYEKADNPAQITNVQVTNNVLGKGYWFWANTQLTEPVWTNNIDYGTGQIVSVDNTLSSAPVTQPSAPNAPTIASFSTDSGVVGDKITNDNTLDLKGTAAAGSTVKIYDGTTQIGSTTATSTGSWDYISQVLSDAKHTLTATATNASGQTSAASAALTVTVDTKAPAAPTITSDTVNSANQVVASGTAEANSTIKVYDGTTQVGTATTNATGAWTVTTAALAAGTHALTATAIDVAGNVSAASAPFDPVIGSPGSTGSGTSGSGTSGSGTSGTGTTAPAAPTISSFSTDSGVAGDHITSDKTLSLAGTAVANSTVKVFDGTIQLGSVTADATGAWHYTTVALPDGKHSVTATDTVSGVTSKASAALDVTVDSTAPAAPVLLSDPTTHNRATVSGTAEAGSLIKLYEGATLLGTATVASDGDWSVTTPNLKHGSHTFTATATDAAGNTSALSQPIDPPIGSHGGTKDASAVEVTNVRQHWDHTATIKGTADPNSEIKLYDGTTSVGSATTDAAGKWSFQTSDLSGKSHAFTAEQVDTTGHVVGASSGAAIIGTGRSDMLTGTAGNDVMVGKAGADTFQFASNFGQDVIKGFAARGPAHDTIEFSKSVFDSFASVLSHAAQSGHDVVIAAGSDTLTLKNTQLDKLNSHDFHFA